VPAAVAGAVALAGAVPAARSVPAARAAALAAATAALLLAPALPGAWREAGRVADEAALYGRLGDAVAVAGGAPAVRACGPVGTGPLAVPAVAWRLGLPIRGVVRTAVPAGTVFRAPPHPGAEPAPPRAPGLARAGTAGPWEVLRRCAGRP
jgi:hypothetical protein